MINKEQKAQLIKKAEESSIWILENRIASQNYKLITLKGQQVLADNKEWRKLVLKRNIYREILLKKLKEWVKNKVKYPNSNPTYEDYIHSSNYNKFGEAS